MNIRNTLVKLAAVSVGLVATSSAALADKSAAFQFADELDACVAALNDQLDLSGVYRIRHIVTKSDPRGRGYSLTIKTQTFSEIADKQYSAVCVATGNNQPSRLKVAEIVG